MTTETKRSADNILAAIMAHHWAILPESLELIVQIAERHNIDLETIEKMRGEPLDNTRSVTLRDGIATIPATGPMFRYASFFSKVSGATTYGAIATDFNAALENPRVRAIILAIDSPGGELNGNEELAGQIFAARGKKPIAAYVSHMGASAAYWLASAADTIVASPTSILGSIGVVVTVRKAGTRDASGGKMFEIVSTQSPNKRLDPEADEGRASLQRTVDALAEVFVARIAEYRGVSTQHVLAEFGQGGVFVGQASVAAGLADRISDYETLHAELRDRGAAAVLRVPRARRSASTASSEDAMNPSSNTGTTQASAAAGAGSPNAAAAASVSPPSASAPASGSGAGAAADSASAALAPAEQTAVSDFECGRATERERILAIQRLGRPGEEAVVAACVNDPACTAADAALRLRGAEQQAAQGRLAQLRETESSREAPPHAATTSETSAPDAQAEATRILAVHRQVSGRKPTS